MKHGFKERIAAISLSCAMALSGAAAVIPAVTAYADSTKVVTLGADLNESQRSSILRYFGVNTDNVQIIYVNNQDERNRLGSYVPLEQIGTHTISCAYVQPTSSGGIQVKTANLNWVTSHMIAASLSTSGVKNCNVIAAAPFEVSGTGALTGVLMAYEQATGEALSEEKKDVATKELVTTGQVAQAVGQIEATQIVNDIKISVIQQQVTETDEARLQEIVNAAVEKATEAMGEEQTVSLSDEDRQALNDLAASIAEQKYDYEDMQETLDRIDENVQDIENQLNGNPEESSDDEAVTPAPVELDEDSILINTDDEALGENVIMDATIEDILPDDQPTFYDLPENDTGNEDSPFEITTTDSSVTGTETTDDGADTAAGDGGTQETDIIEDVNNQETDVLTDDGTDGSLTDEGTDGSQTDDGTVSSDDTDAGTDEGSTDESDAADAASAPSVAWNVSGDSTKFDSFSLRFYISGSSLPAGGTVTITDASTGEQVAEIDLGDRNSWGSLEAQEAADENGWESATEIDVLTGSLSGLGDGTSYQVKVDAAMDDGSALQAETEAVFKGSSLKLEGSGSLTYMAGSSSTLTLTLPEGAVSAQVLSDDEAVLTVAESDILVPEGESEGQTTVSFLTPGSAGLSVSYLDADGNVVSSDGISVTVF